MGSTYTYRYTKFYRGKQGMNLKNVTNTAYTCPLCNHTELHPTPANKFGVFPGIKNHLMNKTLTNLMALFAKYGVLPPDPNTMIKKKNK